MGKHTIKNMRIYATLFVIFQLALGQDAKTCEKAAVVNTLRVCVRYCAKNYKQWPDCGGPNGPTMENILSLANIPFCEEMYDAIYKRCLSLSDGGDGPAHLIKPVDKSDYKII